MALETRFYWHVSILVKKKKKKIRLSTRNTNNASVTACCLGIQLLWSAMFGGDLFHEFWMIPVSQIYWLNFQQHQFWNLLVQYWCIIDFFFWSLILIKWRSIDIFCNNFIIITYINEPLICFCIIWGFFRGRG